MKNLTIILAVVSGLLLVCTLICGLWMRAQPQIDPSSVSFHVTIAIASIVVTAVTLVLAISQLNAVKA